MMTMHHNSSSNINNHQLFVAERDQQVHRPNTPEEVVLSQSQHRDTHHLREAARHHSMLVVDPVSRKLWIPYECMSDTLARFRAGTPSLCMLFLSGRCRQGPNCHQVHADPHVVEVLRSQVQNLMMCCGAHGDRASTEAPWYDKYEIVFQGGSGNPIPISRLAITQGLNRFIDEYEQANGAPRQDSLPVRVFPNVSGICRLHGQDRCRFGEDCKFIHLCKQLLWNEISNSGISPSQHPRRHSNPQHGNTNASFGEPPSPPMHHQNGGYVRHWAIPQMSTDSLVSMDLTATPPDTPTSPLNSPIVKSNGESWSYEPYNFNPIPFMPPAVDFSD